MNIISGMIIFSVAYLFVVTALFHLDSSKAPFRVGISSFILMAAIIFVPSLFGTIV